MIGVRQKGYTILEVLIFIAVSSLMFVAAINAVGGRQKQVQFTQATREFESKIRDIINDVTTSYYPTNSTVNCVVAGGQIQIQSSSGQNIGTNKDCVYVGKALQFQPGGSEDYIKIYSLAGKRYSDANLTPATSIAESKPKAVAIPNSATFVSTTEDYNLLYGLNITKVIRPTDASFSKATEYGSIGLLSNFGGSNVSEAQTLQIGGIFGSKMGDTEEISLGVINQLTDASASTGLPGFIEKNTDQGLVICLQSPEGKVASITFGVKGSSTTNLQIDDHNTGCDL